MEPIIDLDSRQPFGIINADNGRVQLKIENSDLAKQLAILQQQDGRLNLFATLEVNNIIIFQDNLFDWNILMNGIIVQNATINNRSEFKEFFITESIAKKLKVYFSVLVNNTKKLEYETYIIFINRENSTSYKYLDGFDYTSRDTYMVENEPFYIGSKFLNSLGINYKAKKSYINIENSIYNIDCNNFRVNIENKKYNIIEYIPYLDFEFSKPTETKKSIDLTFFDEVQTVYQFLANAYTFDINNVTGKKLIYSSNNIGSTNKFINLSVFNSPLNNNNLIEFIDKDIFDIGYYCKFFYDNKNTSFYFFSNNDTIFDFIGERNADYADMYLSVTPKKNTNYANSISREVQTRYDINFGLRVYPTQFAMANDFSDFVVKDAVAYGNYDVDNLSFYIWASEFLQWQDNILIDSNYISLHFNNEKFSPIVFYNSNNSIATRFTAPKTVFDNDSIYTAKYYIFIKKNLLDVENINNAPQQEKYFYNINLVNAFTVNNPKYIYRNNNNKIMKFSLSTGYNWIIQGVYLADDVKETNLYNNSIVELSSIGNETNEIKLKIIAKYNKNNVIRREIIQTFKIVNIDNIKIKVLSPLLININPLDKDSGGYYKYFLQCQIYDDDIISQLNIDDDNKSSVIKNEGNGIISTNYLFKKGEGGEEGSLSGNTLTIKIKDKFSEGIIKEIKIKVSIQDNLPPILEERIPTIFVDDNEQSEIKIPFYYPNSLDINIKYEAKIFNINNELKQYITYDDQNNFGIVSENDEQYFIKFKTSFKYDNFNKISIRLVSTNRSNFTPWSNVAFFKTCLKPSIFRLPWDLDIKDEFLYLFEDLWEPVEQVEYRYILKYIDEEKNSYSYSSNKKVLLEDQKIKESTNSYRLILSPFLLTIDKDFNEYISSISIPEDKDIRFYLSVELNIITKNGCYKYLTVDNDDAYSFLFNIRTILSSIDKDEISIINSGNYYGQHSIAYLFNNNINIYSAIPIGHKYKDYTSSFKNVYDIYIVDLLKSGKLFYQNEKTINDFYGAYLIDVTTGKQLNISLNNKISSFKRNLLETKTDTLGGVYPRFYKNANTKYKEFPISGTISYQSLLLFENKFNPLDQYDIDIKYGVRGNQRPLNSTNLTNLEGKNIYSEYEFRKDVLDFLQNTNKFLYKSPTEGNIVVKLMNVSLTPNQQLGRMIYDFTCTAYEVQDLQSYLGGN